MCERAKERRGKDNLKTINDVVNAMHFKSEIEE